MSNWISYIRFAYAFVGIKTAKPVLLRAYKRRNQWMSTLLLRKAAALAVAAPISPPPSTATLRRPPLGEFEHQVMKAVQNCGDEAYGLRIAESLLEIYGSSLAVAQVYVTLNRLEKKGFLSSQTESPRPIRGGRARRVFLLEGKGKQALEQSTAFRQALVSPTNEYGATSEHRPTTTDYTREEEQSRSIEYGAMFAPATG